MTNLDAELKVLKRNRYNHFVVFDWGEWDCVKTPGKFFFLITYTFIGPILIM